MVRRVRRQASRAKADLELLEAGARKADKDVTKASVEQMRAQIKQTETDLERLEVRALVAGEVLKVDVRPGEFVGAPPDKALVVMGNLTKLHVRADVDEEDAWRVKTGAAATARVRGNSEQSYKLEFVRFEPYVIAKQSLTGAATERVDTRVLQVIYRFDDRNVPVFDGQQMDVFIEGTPRAQGGTK